MEKENSIPRFTLDTNLLFEHWKQGLKVATVHRLLELAGRGKIDLAITARVREDVPFQPLSSKLDELPLLGISEIASVARLGYWVLGRDMLGDGEFDQYYGPACELAKKFCVKTPGWQDWDHVHAHFLQHQDYFLTWDKGLLCLSQELLGRFGISIVTPEEALEKLEM